MRADVDEMFAAMGSYAESLPTSTPKVVRRRGEPRRRHQLAAAALVLLLLGGAALAGAVRLGRHDIPPAEPTPKPTVSFTSLTPVGSVQMSLDVRFGSESFGAVEIVGGRAYLAGYSPDHQLRVAGMDLATGAPVFAPVDLGRWVPGPMFRAGPEGLLIAGHREGSSNAVLLVLEPNTGAVRWEQPVNSRVLLWYDFGLVVVSSADHSVRALDWQSGAQRWRRPYGNIQAPVITQELAAPLTKSVNADVGRVDPSHHRLLQIDPDGTLHVVNADTGLDRFARSDVEDAASDQTAFIPHGETLYSIIRFSRVVSYSLDRTDPPTVLYESPPDTYVQSVTPCGPKRICLVVNDQTANGRYVVAMDEASRRELWRAQIPPSNGDIQTVGDRILVDSGQLFDLDGSLGAPRRRRRRDATGPDAGGAAAQGTGGARPRRAHGASGIPLPRSDHMRR